MSRQVVHDRGTTVAGADELRPEWPAGAVGEPGVGVTVGSLAEGRVVSIDPGANLLAAARTMDEQEVGSIVVLDDHDELVGILTERDLLGAVAAGDEPAHTSVAEHMTDEVVTASADWEVYEAAAEMTDHHIRHLVVTEDRAVTGVVSIRDLLLAGQRIELTGGAWVVLRDPLTFSISERRRLQQRLLELDPGLVEEADVDELVAVLVGSWSVDAPVPTTGQDLGVLSEEDRQVLRAAVREELPSLQRAVQPAPGWRHWRSPDR